MVPHLVTALTGPLLDLEKKILEATPAIERWFRMEWQEHTPPFYCSVDLRNAGYKLVDLVVGLRVPEEEEREGLDITSHGESAYHA